MPHVPTDCETSLIGGTWTVEYADGSTLGQYDADSPHFYAPGGEVPFRAIDWDRATAVTFESQFTTTRLDVLPVPEGFRTSLHARHFRAADGVEVLCYLIAVSPEGVRPAEGAVSVFYWFPHGAMHECHLYNCPDVARFGSRCLHGQDDTLAAVHGVVALSADVALAA